MSEITSPQDTSTPATQAAAPQAPVVVVQKGSGLPWLLALVILACISCVAFTGFYIVYQFFSVPARVGQALAEVARPKYDIQTLTTSAIGKMQKQSKLVVLDTTIDVDITKEEGLRSWGVYWGTNRVRIVAKENQIQYVIPLDEISTADFDFDERARTLVVRVPRPQIDENMVSVQSDPAKCYALEYSGGWLRWDKADTLRHAQEALRPAVIQQGRSAPIQQEANRAGLEAVKSFLDPLVTSLTQDGVKLEIKYR